MSEKDLIGARIGLPGGGRAVYGSGGLQLYEHAGRLGSVRLATTPSRTLYVSTGYAPFGAVYDESGVPDRGFTGKYQGTAPAFSGGQYDFPEREYNSIQGRWWTPDPSGLGAVNPNNPQSWNAYSYVGNAPLVATDPLGLVGVGWQQKCEEEIEGNGGNSIPNGCQTSRSRRRRAGGTARARVR